MSDILVIGARPKRGKTAFVASFEAAMNTIHWTDAGVALPDSDETVLVYSTMEDEPVWLGYHDGSKWRSVAGEPWDVTAWAPMPAGPVNGLNKEAQP